MSTAESVPVRLHVEIQRWRLSQPFRFGEHTMTEQNVVVVSLEHRGRVGRGEAAGVYYHGDDSVTMSKQIDAVKRTIERGIDRQSLRALLPPCGARNAIDCALWDLEAKLSGRPAWQIAGISEPRPVVTVFTCGADTPHDMARAARQYTHAKAIKLKLTGEGSDAARVVSVREARPDVWLSVDANQAFTRGHLEALVPTLLDARVQLLEQPFPMGQERWLDDLHLPIRLAADESLQCTQDLPALVGRFDAINIKLDKCGVSPRRCHSPEAPASGAWV